MQLISSSQTTTDQEHTEISVMLLNHLAQKGYMVPKKKVQWVRDEVQYLGYIPREGKRLLHMSRLQAIASLQVPKNQKQSRTFLGITGYTRLWIPMYCLLAKPLYQLTRKDMAWDWTGEHQRAWETLKQSLATASSLALPD
ncbi:hypothetical protein NXF25_018956 [Crotalus adamanteus]|uniref:Uncharacterized protein n=1 Tax=Crotalus adamanteus TaxID=8729 RepID=A0AAW1B0S1_CROAD